LLFLWGALGASAAPVYLGALARAGLALLAVVAIVSAKAYPPECGMTPVDNCYATERNTFVLLLMFAWPVPMAGLTGAALLWAGKHRALRALGLALCGLAAAATLFGLSNGETFWLGPP
jgi:hypothetical protein